MKYILGIMVSLIGFSCCAMDKNKLQSKIENRIKVNGIYHDILEILAIRNTLFKMSNKKHESALQLLLSFCKNDVIDGRSKLNSSKGAQIFMQKKDNPNLKLDLEILSKRELIKKNAFGYVVPFIVQDVVKASVHVDQEGMIKISEPTNILQEYKEKFGREWQYKIRESVKK